MTKIKIMNENLANKIAAGEVVERISSVVKELVENSLDANSKNIKIILTNSGTSKINIIDDGDGMNKEDAKTSFLRHATSKIYKEDDLFFISSLGFRGEALPSIASVSKITLETSTGSDGYTINIEGGKIIDEKVSKSRKGTSIIVKDLFYNTPARLKYLKSEQTELFNTTNLIEKLSLSYNDVSFTLINNDKEITKTSGSNNLLKTIHELYGLNTSKNMLKVEGSNNDFDIYGYISKPEIHKSTRNYITTIVNNRVVKNIDLNRVINDAYHTYKPDNKFPVVILKINTDPTLIDVNIHPTKQDIKFSKFSSLEDIVFTSIKNTLNNNLLIPKINIKKEENNYEIKPDLELVSEQITLDFNQQKQEIKSLELYPVGLLFGTYIIAQNDEGMYLIDQHAAEERINYENILDKLSRKEINTINMLIPFNIELTPSDYISFKENKHILENIGFVIDDFGINTITIKSHPIWILEGYETETINKIIELTINTKKDFDLIKFNDKVAASAACKESIKGNTNITLEEMENTLSKLVKCNNPYSCPHGRPTIINFTKYEIEKMFKRTGF